MPAQDCSIDLRAVTVRPTWGAENCQRWDRLMAKLHYLSFHYVFGKGLRHVAVHGESRVALIGWQPMEIFVFELTTGAAEAVLQTSPLQ